LFKEDRGSERGYGVTSPSCTTQPQKRRHGGLTLTDSWKPTWTDYQPRGHRFRQADTGPGVTDTVTSASPRRQLTRWTGGPGNFATWSTGRERATLLQNKEQHRKRTHGRFCFCRQLLSSSPYVTPPNGRLISDKEKGIPYTPLSGTAGTLLTRQRTRVPRSCVLTTYDASGPGAAPRARSGHHERTCPWRRPAREVLDREGRQAAVYTAGHVWSARPTLNVRCLAANRWPAA